MGTAEKTGLAGEMTSRQRIQAVMNGEEPDRFPVWLKMLGNDWRNFQPEPYRSMPNLELQQRAGCDPMDSVGVNVQKKEPHVTVSVVDGENKRTTHVRTPDGEMTGEERYDTSTSSWHPTKFMADTPENLRKLRWLYTDTRYTVEPESADAAMCRQAEFVEKDVFTMAGIGPGPLMNLIEHMSGPIQCIYLMNDEPELFIEILELMHQDRMRHLKSLLPHIQADTFWLTENTSTTLISPQMFEKHCISHLREYGNLILEHDIYPVHHMCGTLNALLEMIDTLPAAANEAYTTRPLGDVSLAEGRQRMPSKTLIGGTNATLWLEPMETIVETVRKDLAECADRKKIFLTSAGVLSPLVSFEKAREVVSEFRRLSVA